jgi:hypothetical protein
VNIGGVVIRHEQIKNIEGKGKRRETETHREKRELSTQTKKYTP